MGSLNWVLSTGISHSATHSWFAQDGGAVSDKVIATPAFGVTAGSTISFWHTYAFDGGATCSDGGTLEITTNGGSTWTVLPNSTFISGGFTGTVDTCCSNPIAGL